MMKKQLQETEVVRFENVYGNGIRILFAGNSITLHGVLTEIGWNVEWGMAASAKEKDYVHRIMSAVRKEQPDAAFCICQVAEWECKYQNGALTNALYEQARNFEADVIVMRFIENCPAKEFDKTVFKNELGKLLDYLNGTGKAKIIMTTGFWRHPGDEAIVEYAKEKNLPLVELGDLGDDDAMKALGLFEHNGIANHPGDLGMEKIAERIFEVIKRYL